MWEIWKKLLMEIIDKHAPLKSKRASKKNSPWITYELSRKIHKRNYLKRKATLNNDVTTWQQYKHARNETNNAIRTAKRHYFKDNLEFNKKNPRKTWELINELSLSKSAPSI